MGQKMGTIGQSVVIQGELSAREDLTIEGQVNGKIELDDNELTVGPNGRIEAEILAKVVNVMGKVDGNITASDTINIRETAIAYQEYEADFMPTLEPYGGVLVAVSDEPAVLEGEWSPERVVVLRFDSRQRALDWYQSSEYQQLAVLRRAMSTGTDILIDGRR